MNFKKRTFGFSVFVFLMYKAGEGATDEKMENPRRIFIHNRR